MATRGGRGEVTDGFWDEVARRNDERFGEGRWHCDDILCEQRIGCPVQAFLAHARAPAIEQTGERPRLFATYEGERVRVTMASRFGDVGISRDLAKAHGYFKRVYLPELTDLSEAP